MCVMNSIKQIFYDKNIMDEGKKAITEKLGKTCHSKH